MFLSFKCSFQLDLSACTDKTLSRSSSSLVGFKPLIADIFGIDITFLSLLCLHGCSRCNLDIISSAHLWLCHPWSCCIWLKRGREPPAELVSASSRQEVCPRTVCVFAEWGDLSQITHLFFHYQPALAAGVRISKTLVTLLVAVHVCFIFNLTSHLCSRAYVRRIKCKQSDSSAG